MQTGLRDLMKSGRRYPLRMRGETFVASFGIAVMAILIGVLVATSWWTVHSQRTAMTALQLQEIRVLAKLISQSAEALMLSDGLSPLRRMIMESRQAYRLERCRIILPDGQVVADVDPSRITLKALPANWPSGDVGPAIETIVSRKMMLRNPLNVVGRGEARLELAAPLDFPFWATWETQSGIGTIGVVAMVALLFGYRHARVRLRAMVTIREALLAYQGEQTPAELLSVSPDFGAEAVAWNDMISQTEKLRKKKLAEEVREGLEAPHRAASHLEEACDAMSQGIILLDETLHVRYANGAAAIFAKADRQAIMGVKVDHLFRDDDVLEAIRMAVDTNTRRRSVVESQQADQNGVTVLRFSIRPVRRSDPAAVMIVIDDITQQRVADQARNDFVSQVAHELRAPLSNICLYVESLLTDDRDEELRARSINVINLETRRLTHLVSDMLSVAEIEAGSMQVQSDDIRLDAVFQELEADYKAQVMEKNIKLAFSLPPKLPVIQADREKIVMAMHNLVGNAVKYTPHGGQIDVRVEVAADRLLMEVSDTGLGITAEDQKRIFEKFYRARDDRLAGIPGTGLGLPLAREVVRLHGGDISVESEYGKGSTFTLSLPTHTQAA